MDDVTPDGLVIQRTKFRKSRLVPLDETARIGLERYLQQRRRCTPLADHVFVSVLRKPLRVANADRALRIATREDGLPNRSRQPTPHALRHAFATRAMVTKRARFSASFTTGSIAIFFAWFITLPRPRTSPRRPFCGRTRTATR
jgi:integrase